MNAQKNSTLSKNKPIWLCNKTDSDIFKLRTKQLVKSNSNANGKSEAMITSNNGARFSDYDPTVPFQTIKKDDGSIYKGQVINGKRHGRGSFQDGNGNQFEGDFRGDKIEGFGTYKTNEGIEYVGEWKNDLQDGQGKEKWPDGSHYEGQYLQGVKNGKGKYVWEDGSVYTGQWNNGNMEGEVI